MFLRSAFGDDQAVRGVCVCVYCDVMDKGQFNSELMSLTGQTGVTGRMLMR